MPARAAQPSGTVIAVIQRSEADGQTGRRVLVAEAAVFSGDKIITGPVGQAQIRFRDDTRLVVGPNSQMTIDALILLAAWPWIDAQRLALSVLAAAAMNFSLAVNHRPGRYMAF